MNVSFTELRTTYMLTFEALGFGAGSAFEAATMATWCDVHGFDGIGLIHSQIARPPLGEYRPPEVVTAPDGALCLDALGNSLFRIGPGVLEIGHAEFVRGQTDRVRIVNVEDLGVIPGLAFIATQRAIVGALQGCMGGTSLTAFASPTAQVEVIWSTQAFANDELVICYGEPDDRLPNADVSHRLSPDLLRQREEHALVNGLSFPDADWRQVLDVAKQYLVPESDQSRERGAGIGANVEG